MQSQVNEHQAIFSYLRSLNFHFLDSWVIECVNYYKSNHPNISFEDLKNEVRQQWLLVNLREIKVPSLPPDLKFKKKIILDGCYAVQVESMIDSGKSCYSQLQKLLKINTENIEFTKKPDEHDIQPKRCLTFVMSDGVQEIRAMEYQPIAKIKTNDPELLPGFKMIILGPVECRKGMILLKDENVRLCGGEVDTLTVTNKLKNLLIRKLGLDESDYPDSSSSSSLQNESQNPKPASIECISEDNLGNKFVESLLSQNDDLFLSIPLESGILEQKSQSRENVKNNQDFISENEFFSENINIHSSDELIQDNNIIINKKHLLPQEDLEMPLQKKVSLDPDLSSKISSFEEEDSLFKSSLNTGDEDIFVDNFYKPEPGVLVNSSKTIKPVQTKLSSFFINSNSKLHSDKIFTDIQKISFIGDKPFVYLKQIMSVKLTKSTVFTVKAVILTLKKKITIEKDEFNLKVNITDGSTCLDVNICSVILEEFLGFSPCEICEMLKIKQKNTAIAQKMKESFSKAQEKLIHLNCLMNIKFFTEGRCPLILSLEEVNAQHVRDLKERIQ